MNSIRILRHGIAMGVAAAFTLAAGFAAAQAGKSAAIDLSKDAKLIAAAKAEGSVVVYGAPSVAALKADADAFQKTYGIPMQFTQITAGPMTARIDQEIRAGRINADVMITADRPSLYRWAADNQLAKLPDMKFPEQNEYMAPIQSIYQAVLVNTSSVSKADMPKTWADVLNPKYSGKIVLGSPRIGTAYSLLYLALLKDPKYGEAYFEKLAANKARVVQNNPLVAQLTAAGEASFGFTGIPYDATNVVKANPGAPITYVYLDIVTAAYTYVVVNAKAQRPNAGRLLAAWLMSREGQMVHNGENRASSLLGNLPGTLAAPDMKNVRRDITVEKVTGEYQNIISLFERTFK
jgi:iron(III) transport system substrate-binding protein